jgi:aspartyl aminopeptidase
MNSHIQDLLTFLDNSPTSVQASLEIARRLQESGFEELDEGSAWKLDPGGKYYVRRLDTTVIAFVIGSRPLPESGFNLASSHIDSPSLKLKPDSLHTEKGITQIGVEVYGGPIISTWTDRELGIAGRVVVKRNGELASHAVDLKDAVAIIPNVAIHLNREVNKGFEYNKQTHLQAILNTSTDAGNPLLSALAAALDVNPEQIAEMDLFLYDKAKATLAGLDRSLVVSGRLDNLGMTHAILSSLREVRDPGTTCVGAFYDHEEIGSQSPQGAASSLLSEVLERLSLALGCDREQHYLALRRSFMVSGDMAHAYIPAYKEKYDPAYAPVMNQGPVIKFNSSLRYASTAESSARFASLCEKAGVKYQKFLMRSDLLCGSTVGPIVSAQFGIPTVDVGNPMWAMHSVRETCGAHDHSALIQVLKQYYL